MAFESTAIRDLVAGVQQKPLDGESSDWLFGESEADLFAEPAEPPRADATQIDPRAAHAPELDLHRGVALPRSFAQLPYPHVDLEALRRRAQTAQTRGIDWAGIAKKLALPVCLVSIVSVALGVYYAKTDEAAAQPRVAAVVAAAAQPGAPATRTMPAAQAVESAPAPRPVEAAVAHTAAEAAVAPTAAEAAMAPTAAEAAMAPTSAEAAMAPTAGEAAAPVVPEAAPAPTAPAPAPVATPPAAAAPTAVADAPPEQLNVEPGSPASRFLAPPPVETTITTAAKPAPAPTAVPELAATPAAATVATRPTRSTTKSAANGASSAKRAKTKPAVTSAARNTARPAQARTTKKSVSAADAKTGGKGILQITSSPAMQVWVDGRNSKAMTPVRIRLLAGKHRISLLDNQRGAARSFDVVIKADETTKVSKSF